MQKKIVATKNYTHQINNHLQLLIIPPSDNSNIENETSQFLQLNHEFLTAISSFGISKVIVDCNETSRKKVLKEGELSLPYEALKDSLSLNSKEEILHSLEALKERSFSVSLLLSQGNKEFFVNFITQRKTSSIHVEPTIIYND